MNENLSEILLKMIYDIDLNDTNIGNIMNIKERELALIAGKYGIAKLEVVFKRKPGFLCLKGDIRSFSREYSFNIDPDIPPVEENYISNEESCHAKIYPVADHEWDDEVRKTISTIAKAIFITVSRASCITLLNKSKVTDPVTGLINHVGVITEGHRAVFTQSMSSYTGIFINLADFKYINRRVGEKAGNEILRRYGMHVYNFADPDHEIVGRLGGDNFFLLILKERIGLLTDHLSNCVFPITDPAGNNVYIKVESRMGIYDAKPEDQIEDVLNCTSTALAYAKTHRIMVTEFMDDMLAETMKEKQITSAIPRSIARGEFVPFYQPKVDMRTGEMCGCEALVRWIRDGEVVPPADFLPVIEKNGMASTIDFYMLEYVCKDINRWVSSGIDPVPVSVNFSKRDLFDPEFAFRIKETLTKAAVDPKYIEIELTETSGYDDFDALMKFIDEMHSFGICVSMDDFGSGYSSLNLLKNMSFDIVKLDKTFVDDVVENEGEELKKDIVVIGNIINMLIELGVDVIAEGIESREQLMAVRKLKCDIIQGFIFDRPLPREEFEKRLNNKKYNVEEYT